jgi:hypothetical protein
MKEIPNCRHTHGGKQCQAPRHTTSGNKITSYCSVHYKRYRSKRPKPERKSDTVARESQRLKDVLHKRSSRQKNKDALADIADVAVRNIATRMAEIREKGLNYIVINSVVEHLVAKDIGRLGPKEPINFTDESHNKSVNVTRSMQLVDRPERYIPQVLDALKHTFTGCKTQIVKIITSTAKDPAQLTHTDFDTRHIHTRVSSLKHFHYSAIIAIEPNTHLLIGKERKRVEIPVQSMLLFRGDLPHAGGAYIKANSRIFVSISSEFYPLSNAVYIVK